MSDPADTALLDKRKRKTEAKRIERLNKLVKVAQTIQEGERRCRARVRVKNDDGTNQVDEQGEQVWRPCGNYAIKGGWVCWQRHGGSNKRVRANANKRLLALVEPALVRLEGLINQTEHLPTALAAVRTVLERAGAEAIGPLAKAEEKDMRPIIQVGIRVGGIPLPGDPPKVEVATRMLNMPGPAAVIDAEPTFETDPPLDDPES